MSAWIWRHFSSIDHCSFRKITTSTEVVMPKKPTKTRERNLASKVIDFLLLFHWLWARWWLARELLHLLLSLSLISWLRCLPSRSVGLYFHPFALLVWDLWCLFDECEPQHFQAFDPSLWKNIQCIIHSWFHDCAACQAGRWVYTAYFFTLLVAFSVTVRAVEFFKYLGIYLVWNLRCLFDEYEPRHF